MRTARRLKHSALKAFLAALVLSISIVQVLAEPFAFRGVPLGITVAEFKKAQFPDPKYPNSKVLCTGDVEFKRMRDLEAPPINPDLRRIGVVGCAFYSPTNSRGQFFRNAPDLANIGGYETFYLFAPMDLKDEAHRGRLYLIRISPPSNRFKTVIDAFAERYGKPAMQAKPVIKNRLGAEFEDEIAVWENEQSSVMLQKYFTSITSSLVVFTHKSIAAAVDAASRSVAKENAGKL